MNEITNKTIQDWVDKEKQKIFDMYVDESRKPKEYQSNEEALLAIEDSKSRMNGKALSNGNRKADVGEAAEIIIETTSVMIIPTVNGHTVAFWDYDEKKYTIDVYKMLNDYLTILLGSSSQIKLNNLTLTLIGLRRKAVIYNPLPNYLIPVGNGLYNCLTKKLEPSSAYYAILTRISTNYYESPKQPQYKDGFTLESMINTLSNNNSNRIALLKQIVKSILLGYNVKPGLFVILGKGGDGKSTFFTMIANLIGQENVAYVNFSQLNEPDKMAETINKKFVLGVDNDVKLYIKKTAMLKTIASHEIITLSRKYLSAISVPFTATMVQLCNEFPRIAETGSSIKRRIVPFKAENSYYEHGTENDNVDSIYCRDKKFLEYALYFFLNEEKTPYYSDFNDVDRSLTIEALNIEDTIGQFVDNLELNDILHTNKCIPTSHLYASYLDWATESNVSVMSSINFTKQLTPKLEYFGYVLSDKSIRLTTLEKSGEYDRATWGELANLPKLSDIIEKDRSSRFFELKHKPKKVKETRRKSKKISALEYFKLTDKIMNKNEDKNNSNDVEVENISNNIEYIKQVEEVELNESDSNETPETNLISMKVSKEELNKLRKWLLDIYNQYSNKEINELRFNQLIEKIIVDMKNTSRKLKNTELMGFVTDINSASTNNTIWIMQDYLDAYELLL